MSRLQSVVPNRKRARAFCLLLGAISMVAVAACVTPFPEDDWYDFVMKSCSHLNDQEAFNHCYHDGTRARTVCHDAGDTSVCRDSPYPSCDRAQLGDEYGSPPHSSGCG
jgi:hypothetical protein